MCQNKPLSPSLGILSIYTPSSLIFLPAGASSSCWRKRRVSFPSSIAGQGLLQPKTPIAKLTAKGLRASSLPTALPTPCTLQVSLVTAEFNSGKEEKNFRHTLHTENPMDSLRRCLLCKGFTELLNSISLTTSLTKLAQFTRMCTFSLVISKLSLQGKWSEWSHFDHNLKRLTPQVATVCHTGGKMWLLKFSTSLLRIELKTRPATRPWVFWVTERM